MFLNFCGNTHIKGRLLDQAVILLNCVGLVAAKPQLALVISRYKSPFSYWELLLKERICSFPTRAVPYGMEIAFGTLADLIGSAEAQW